MRPARYADPVTDTAPRADEPSTRDRLLDAAIGEFLEHGYEGTRVNQIARRAGLTTGAIYSKFATKSELLTEAIAARGTAGLIAVAGDQGAPETLHDLAEMIGADPLPEHRLVLELFSAATRDATAAALVARTLDAADRRIQHAIDERRSDPSDADGLDVEAVRFVVQLLALGSFVTKALAREHPDPAAIEQVLRQMFARLDRPPA